jgi:hypothetical protein
MIAEDKIIEHTWWSDVVVCVKFVLGCCGLAVAGCGIGVGFNLFGTNYVDDLFKGKNNPTF